MPNYPTFNLTGKTPEATFQNIVQTNAASSSLVDGLGNEIEFFNLTASKAVSASWAPTNNPLPDITNSNKNIIISASTTITSSLTVGGVSSFNTVQANGLSASTASISLMTASIGLAIFSPTASIPTNTGSVVGWMTFQGVDGHTYFFPLYR